MIKTYPHNIFKILAAIILLGVIAAGYISWQRYNVEAHATTVEMVYDYNNILESASVESTSADELFPCIKEVALHHWLYMMKRQKTCGSWIYCSISWLRAYIAYV